jgi:hypothetical protein
MMRMKACFSRIERSLCAAALLLGLSAIAVGCGGSSENDDDDAGPVAADDFSQRFAVTYCSSIQACCQRFDEPFELSSCRDAVSGYLSGVFNVYFDNPRLVYDEAVAGDCIAAYGAVLSACTERSDAAEDACDGLFRGTVEPGGACGESNECNRSAEQSASCESGVCVINDSSSSPYDGEPVGLGEPCSATCEGDDEGGSCSGFGSADPNAGTCLVSDGLVCGQSGTCEAVPQLGQPCAQYYYCEPGSYCGAAGACQAASDTGPCTSDSACTTTSYCDYDLGQCTPLKADGALCDSGNECLGGDCEADRCRAWSVASAAACAGLLDD